MRVVPDGILYLCLTVNSIIVRFLIMESICDSDCFGQGEGLALVAVEVGTGGKFAGDGGCAVALGVGVYCGPEGLVEPFVGEEGRGVERLEVGHGVAFGPLAFARALVESEPRPKIFRHHEAQPAIVFPGGGFGKCRVVAQLFHPSLAYVVEGAKLPAVDIVGSGGSLSGYHCIDVRLVDSVVASGP